LLAKNVLSWDASTGYKITGSCEATCTEASFSLTASASTSGTTCSSTVYGNVYTIAQMDVVDVTTTTTTTTRSNASKNELAVLAMLVLQFILLSLKE